MAKLLTGPELRKKYKLGKGEYVERDKEGRLTVEVRFDDRRKKRESVEQEQEIGATIEAIKTQYARGLFVDPKRLTYEQFFYQWFESYKPPRVKGSLSKRFKRF